ncbi:MAG: hypothetical protein IT440_13975 [Phycisphaeraceae bacterium]|nr:hypothetical protein [Phycisphaeraceae bacterium]
MMVTQTAVGPEVTNGGVSAIRAGVPYMVDVLIEGTADLLFHRWNCEAVAEKASAAKGSKAKKTDDVESFLYRNETGEICLPGEYVRQAIIAAAKFRQDPRSPRKSAMDLFKAAVIGLTPQASLGVTDPDYQHRCRVTVQRNGITRTRPAIKAGWRAEMTFLVNLPEYVTPDMLHDTLAQAGKLIGVGDFRPTYGRFQIRKFDLREN